MKKFICISAAVAALFAISSCSKENISPAPEPAGKTVNIRFNAGDAGDTRTGVEYYSEDKKHTPYWNKGDEIGVFFDAINGKKSVDVTLANSNEKGAEALFGATGVSLNNGTEPGNAGTVYSFYPAIAFEAVATNKDSVRVNINKDQYPAAVNTYDPKADILVGEPTGYTFNPDGNNFEARIRFARVMSVVKISLKAGDECPEGLAVNRLTMTAPEGTVLTGRVTLSLDKISGGNSPLGKWTVDNKEVSAIYEGEAKPVIGGEANNTVYLIVNPTSIESGDITFTIDTDDYSIEKTVTLTNALTFPQSNVANINLTIAGANCTAKVAEARIWVENFDKVTKQSQATPSQTGAAGTGVTESLEYEYSTDNTNVRVNNNGHGSGNPFLWISGEGQYLQVSNIAVSGETDLKFSCQVKTTQSTADVTLKYRASTAEEWNTAAGKISANTTSINKVQSLIFTISEDVTSLDLRIVGSAGNLVVDDIVLEKFVDERTTLATPTDVTPAVDSKTSNKINVTWTAVENADSYEVTLATTGEEDVVETSTTNSISFTGLKYSTQYSVKVKAISSDVTSYKDSEYSEPVNVTTGEKPAVQIDWVKKAVADILPTDEVVLVGNNANSLKSTATSSNPALVAVTVSDGKLTSEVTDDMKWNLVENTTDGFILYANGTTDRYLYCNTTAKSSSNTCIRVGSLSSNIRNLWTIDKDGYMITKDTYTTRYLSVYTEGLDWRGYANTSNGAQKVEFYVKDDPRTALATPEITVTPDNTAKKITVTWGAVDNAADYTVTCTGQTDQTVTGTSCEFTGLEYGDYTVTVKANPAAGSTTHKSSEKASKDVSLVDTTPVIAAENPAAVEADATSVEVSYTVTNKVEGTNLTAAVTSGAWISNPQVASDKVTFTLAQNTSSEQRTGTVTLSYAGAADKVITITQKGAGQVGYASLEDLVAAGAPTGANVTLTFSNKEIIDFYKSGQYTNGIWLSVVGAPDGKIEIYCKNVPAEWEVGGLVSGTLTDCVWKKYNDIWELCPSNWDAISYIGPCATPVITLDGAKASISCATEGATILYEISDTEPASFTHTYTSAVTLEDGQTIWAKATLAGHPDSKVASKKYTAGGSDYTTKKTVTYAQSSTSAASCTGGTAPTGSSVSFTTTYSNKDQLTNGNKMTLTLKGYADKKITGLTLSMKSNKSDGAGYLSFTAGSNTLASIGSSSSGVKFNNAAWNGSFTTSYTNVVVSMADATHIVANGEDLVIVIGATVNSLYCQSFTIEYYE